MKRLIILAAVALLTASSSGCWHWFNRGAACNTCGPTGSTFGGATYGSDPYYAAPSVDTYQPGPVVQ